MFSISRIQQLIKPISRGRFKRLAEQHQADRYVKRFDSWQHLLAMLYAQWSGAGSLRQLLAGFNAQHAQHYHLGAARLQRSTLADANARRSPEVFADLVRSLMAQTQRSVRQPCQALLYLLDSSSISVQGPGFDAWTACTRTRNTQGMKLHLLLDRHTHTPLWQALSAPNVNDCTVALALPIEAGATYVFDKGYCDYQWWARIHAQQAWFVTRFKRNAAVTVQQQLPVPEQDRALILSDQCVSLRYHHAGGRRRNPQQLPLRRIEVARPGETPLVLATNDLCSPAAEIARMYRQRWQVELYFKWIKQHLNIKRFIGRSENAVKTQILTALIAYLLLQLYAKTHALKCSLWELLAELRVTLFQRPAAEASPYERRRRLRQQMQKLQPPLFT